MSGWIYYAHTDKCYKEYKGPGSSRRGLTFQGARDWCKAQAPKSYKGDSVALKDSETNEFVRSITRWGHVWTSGHKVGKKWFWGDNTEFTFTRWRGMSSTDRMRKEDYVAFITHSRADNNMWYDLNGKSKRWIVCAY